MLRLQPGKDRCADLLVLAGKHQSTTTLERNALRLQSADSDELQVSPFRDFAKVRFMA